MINQIRADLYRQSHSIGMAIITLLTIVWAMLSTQQEAVGGVSVNAPEKMLNRLIAKHWSVLDGIHAANFAGTFMLWLFIVALVIVFSREFSQKTYKNTLVSGISRLKELKRVKISLSSSLFFIIYFLLSISRTPGPSWLG